MRQETMTQATGDSAIQTAIQMEELGRDFYDALAGAGGDPKVIALCRNLSADESKHLDVFRRMRSEMARQGQTVLLTDERLAEARRKAKEAILPDPETMRRMATGGSVADLFEMAMQMERDAIRFYSAIAEGLPEKTAVEAVIEEERNHLRVLSAARGQAGS